MGQKMTLDWMTTAWLPYEDPFSDEEEGDVDGGGR